MPPSRTSDWALQQYFELQKEWERKRGHISGRRVDLHAIIPGTRGGDKGDNKVRSTGVQLWMRP